MMPVTTSTTTTTSKLLLLLVQAFAVLVLLVANLALVHAEETSAFTATHGETTETHREPRGDDSVSGESNDIGLDHTPTAGTATATSTGTRAFVTTLLLILIVSLVWVFQNKNFLGDSAIKVVKVDAKTQKDDEEQEEDNADDDGRTEEENDDDGDDDDDDDWESFGEYDVVFAVDGSLLGSCSTTGNQLFRKLVESSSKHANGPPTPQRRSRRNRSVDPTEKARVEDKMSDFYDVISEQGGRFVRQQQHKDDTYNIMLDNEALNIVSISIAVGSCDEPIALG